MGRLHLLLEQITQGQQSRPRSLLGCSRPRCANGAWRQALQARPSNVHQIPSKAIVAKRLSQCLNPALPSGVHQKALEAYSYIFTVIGNENLSRDLPLYLPGLAATLSFASLTVRAPFLDVMETYILGLSPRALRPAMKSVILALLPGLEEETGDDFERTIKLLNNFKVAVRSEKSVSISDHHSTGDDFFWQCLFLACVTSQSRRPGALAYLVRYLPRLGPTEHSKSPDDKTKDGSRTAEQLMAMVTSPEPGLLLRCFAAGLSDEQLLIQRGFLDLLVTNLPLHSKVLQSKIKSKDLSLLLRAAVGVVARRDMSLNRRLWAWFLGPEPAQPDAENGLESPTSEHHQQSLSPKTTYFEEYGLHQLTSALLEMISATSESSPAEKARPYRISLSLMDRWEIGGLVVPEVFLPVIESVRRYKAVAPSKADFTEVLKSASVFFDGVESGLIYGEIVGLMAQALAPGGTSVSQREDKIGLIAFMVTHFNVREEEMVRYHAPLASLAILSMVSDTGERFRDDRAMRAIQASALKIAHDLLDLVPERAFPTSASNKDASHQQVDSVANVPNGELLKRIREFYVTDQGNLDAASPPYSQRHIGELLLQKANELCCESLTAEVNSDDLGTRSRILALLLFKTPSDYHLDMGKLIIATHSCLSNSDRLPFVPFAAILKYVTHLNFADRLPSTELSELVAPLVQHAWEYLSPSEPKFHVETVRNLWLLQTALSPANRDIEAAICTLILKNDVGGTYAARPATSARKLSVLWTHTLQDNAQQADRRMPKTPNGDSKLALPRLPGNEYYDTMLTRPILLLLDALVDDRTQLYIAVKAWLSNLVGIDKYDVPLMRAHGVGIHANIRQTLSDLCQEALGAGVPVAAFERRRWWRPDTCGLATQHRRRCRHVYVLSQDIHQCPTPGSGPILVRPLIRSPCS